LGIGISQQDLRSFGLITWSWMELVEPLNGLPRPHQLISRAVTEFCQQPPVGGDPRSAQKSRPIRRLRDEHRLNYIFSGFEIAFGEVHVSQVRHSWPYTLDFRDSPVCGGHLQCKYGVSLNVCSQPPQVLQRGVYNQLPGFGSAGQFADLSVYIEQPVRQLP